MVTTAYTFKLQCFSLFISVSGQARTLFALRGLSQMPMCSYSLYHWLFRLLFLPMAVVSPQKFPSPFSAKWTATGCNRTGVKIPKDESRLPKPIRASVQISSDSISTSSACSTFSSKRYAPGRNLKSSADQKCSTLQAASHYLALACYRIKSQILLPHPTTALLRPAYLELPRTWKSIRLFVKQDHFF